MNNVEYAFPEGDGTATGKLLATNGAGQLVWTTDQTGAGGGRGSALIQEGDETVVITGSTLDFNASDFDISESPQNEANIVLSTLGLQARLNNSYVSVQGDTMTGGLLIHSTNDTTVTVDNGVLLEVAGLLSGYSLRIQDRLSASGTVAFEDEVTFGSGIIINGITYVFPAVEGGSGTVLATDGDGQLTWTSTTAQITVGQGLTNNGTAITLSAVHSGTTIEATTLLSGTLVHATTNLTSSGGLSVDGDIRFQTTTDSTSGLRVLDADGGTSVFNIDTTNERVGIGVDAPGRTLDVGG
ncbi:MAG: hypothetical protein QGH82_03490, partial [Candidatus Woesearchaeota archaeon]|nr:hypothetical protein [Candidatus Woesearchaeota archaeon]